MMLSYTYLMIDLHVHSNYSDGTCSIEEILRQAESLGLSQIAITDHNILKGSILASEKANINYIIGTELSVSYKGVEVHLLSYFPNGSDYKNVQFIINEGEAYKKIAILEMVENLNAMGIDIQITELSEFTKGVINRVHICKAMMKHGYINSVEEGFRKYVGDDCPAYVERKTVTLADAIEAIHLDGGIAVVAHPYEYDDLKPIENFLNDIIDDVDGIECFHPSATPEQSQILVSIAKAHNKLITGGSDFHGENKPDISLNKMQVDDKYMIKKI